MNRPLSGLLSVSGGVVSQRIPSLHVTSVYVSCTLACAHSVSVWVPSRVWRTFIKHRFFLLLILPLRKGNHLLAYVTSAPFFKGRGTSNSCSVRMDQLKLKDRKHFRRTTFSSRSIHMQLSEKRHFCSSFELTSVTEKKMKLSTSQLCSLAPTQQLFFCLWAFLVHRAP